MPQKKGQYDLSDLDVSQVTPKGKYTEEDLHPNEKKVFPKEMTESGQLDPGSVANIANPVGSIKQGASRTGPTGVLMSAPGVARSGLNLVGALGAGAEEHLGIDPSDQLGSLPGAIINTAIGIGNTATPKGAIGALSGIYHGIVDAPGEMSQGIRENNPDKFISGLGGTAVTTVPTISGIMEGASALKSKPQPQFDPNKPQVQLPKPPRAASDLAKVHGGDSSYELRERIENEIYPAVKNDLKQSELDVLNRPVKTTEEHFTILKDAANRIWNEYKPYLTQGSTIDGNEVVNRAVGSYDKSVQANHPEEFNNFKSKLETAFKDQKLSPEDAQARLTQLNAEANGFYALNNASDMAARAKLSGAQKYLATSDALRSILDEHLPEGAKDVRGRYGNIAELMGGMPMPSEAGKGFFKAMFDESAKAMSTRPGFAMTRGGLRALGAGGTDRMIRRVYSETPYGGNPATSPTSELTHPLTGEKQVVPRGPSAQIRTPLTQAPSHPMSPREVLQGNHPLEIAPHPLDTPRINTGLPIEQPLVTSSPHPTIAPQLESIGQRIGSIPDQNLHHNYDFTPYQKPPQIPTAIPAGSTGDVRYQSVKPANVPTGTMQLMNRGTFSEGMPSTGLPIQAPSPETLRKLGGQVRSGLKLKTKEGF